MSAAFEAMMMRRRGWEARVVRMPPDGASLSHALAGGYREVLKRRRPSRRKVLKRRGRCGGRPSRRIQRMRGEKEWAGMIEIVAFANLYTTRVEKNESVEAYVLRTRGEKERQRSCEFDFLETLLRNFRVSRDAFRPNIRVAFRLDAFLE